MGWTFSYSGRRAPTVAQELQNECLQWTHLPEAQRPSVIAHATGSGVVAFAVKFPKAYFDEYAGAFADYVRDADGGVRCALVFLYKDGREFGYKDLSETMGPCEPVAASLLRHLSALNLDRESARWAQRWRNDCAAYSARKAATSRARNSLTHGAKVTLAAPLRFGRGSEAFDAQVFRCVYRAHRGAMRPFFKADNGVLCRVPAASLASATIEPLAYLTGDGATFPTMEAAKAHAEAVHKATGAIVAIELA